MMQTPLCTQTAILLKTMRSMEANSFKSLEEYQRVAHELSVAEVIWRLFLLRCATVHESFESVCLNYNVVRA